MDQKITRAELQAALSYLYTEFKERPENFAEYNNPEEDASNLTEAIFNFIKRQGV